MENETKQYVEYINNNHNWLKKIIIEFYQFLIDHEHINFLMQMYMKWSKDDGSFSSSYILSIMCLSCF